MVSLEGETGSSMQRHVTELREAVGLEQQG
jgi:hypothetical protein